MATISEILQDAIKLEQDGEKYYRDAALEVSNPLGKNTFLALADQEVEHARILRAFCDAVDKGDTCPTPQEVDAKEYSVVGTATNIFAKAREELGTFTVLAENLTGLYDDAMEMERKSIKLYTEAAAKAEKPEEREFFEYLAKQERGHLHILSQGQEYLDDPESWYIEEEQWGVTG